MFASFLRGRNEKFLFLSRNQVNISLDLQDNRTDDNKKMPEKREAVLHFPYPLDRTLVLVGMPGCGKSSIGRRLARIYSLPFVDADVEIEKAGGGDVCYLFERYGEAAFRQAEQRIMARLLDAETCILASGGGAFLSEMTRENVKNKAVGLFLDASIETIARNTAGRTHRPLLNVADPRAVIEKMAAVRRPFYEQADLRVAFGDETMGRLLRRIVSKINDFAAKGRK